MSYICIYTYLHNWGGLVFRKGCLLNKDIYEKIQRFSIENEIFQSDLIRKILKDKTVTIKPRSYGQVVIDSKKTDSKNDVFVNFTIDSESKEILKDLKIKHKTTFSEILREKISNADFSKYLKKK